MTPMCMPWRLDTDVVIVWPNVQVRSVLQIAYTSSYTPIWGSVRVDLIPKGRTKGPITLGVINSRDTTSNASVTQMATWGNLTAGMYLLRLTLICGVGTRFKMAGWFSCFMDRDCVLELTMTSHSKSVKP